MREIYALTKQTKDVPCVTTLENNSAELFPITLDPGKARKFHRMSRDMFSMTIKGIDRPQISVLHGGFMK